MPIEVGDKIPNVKLQTMTTNGPRAISMDEICRGQKVVLFAVPGAFTSTCSNDHLPGYVKWVDDIKTKGVDVVACVAVNDVFVMNAWANARGVDDKILMLSDGNGDFAKAMGRELDSRAFGMGVRSQRYAAIIDDGVVKALHQDAPGEVKASGAEAILAQL